jgi:hypothetical protein
LKKKRESCDGRDCGRKERSYEGFGERACIFSMLCLTPGQPSTVNEETTGVKKRKSFTGIHEKANRIGTH